MWTVTAVRRSFSAVRRSFLLEIAWYFFYGRSEGYRSGTAPLIKLRDCFVSITAKNKVQETTPRNSCYYDNYKTRLSMTKYLALRNQYLKKK